MKASAVVRTVRPVVVLTREAAQLGRCLNPLCRKDHAAESPGHAMGLCCFECGKPASVAIAPDATLSIACLDCFVELAVVHLTSCSEAATREAARDAALAAGADPRKRTVLA